ncbi:hypothetical protein [Nocardia sp. CA-120079]|uniref:hypothetical protein n=1 Tax=Nocardia sp. CA-120079 TaxID=3239974 RepID=UPI003D9A0382
MRTNGIRAPDTATTDFHLHGGSSVVAPKPRRRDIVGFRVAQRQLPQLLGQPGQLIRRHHQNPKR